MKHYLHLADSGLVLADLSARLYDTAGGELSTAGLTLTALLPTATDYELDGLPDVPAARPGLTLTTEYPAGVFSAYRFGTAEAQPSGVIIPVREVLADPLEDLAVKVFQDGAPIDGDDLTVMQLADDGEYLVSGWASPSALGEQWSVRWQYEGSVYAVHWTGTARTGLDGAGILSAVEATAIGAGFGFPIHIAGQDIGKGFLGGIEVDIPAGPDAEWVELSMPSLEENQATSGPAALVGIMRPQSLLYARYFGPIGAGSARGLAVVDEIAGLFAGTTMEDSSGGADFEAGVSKRIIGVGPASFASGPFFQVQAWVRGVMLYRRAA